jgi:hypothetical protein
MAEEKKMSPFMVAMLGALAGCFVSLLVFKILSILFLDNALMKLAPKSDLEGDEDDE